MIQRLSWRHLVMALLPTAILISLSLEIRESALAHEGEQHGTPAPGSGTSGGPVRLTVEGRRNLQLEVQDVQLRSLSLGPTAFGVVEPRPGSLAVVSSRISGRTTRVHKVLGDRVRAGEPVIEVESRVVADPPVRVSLSAPIGGIVIERAAEPGQPVEPDQSLLTVADLSKVLFRLDVPETDFAGVAVGQSVDLRLEALPDLVFSGVIRRIAAAASTENRTIPVWAEFDNPAGSLRLQLRGQGRIETSHAESVVMAPRAAILGDAANRTVFLESGADFVPTSVVVGRSDGDWVEILHGLIPGDRVVTRGNYAMQFIVATPDSGGTAPSGAEPDSARGKSSGKRGRFGC
ncbi:MAG: efflux RND transporter periplasmic adaptor subunit [Candidatus Eisenbacteria bacterium]|nr:efflux RND transporter periplasmic adaptor subunit [Candidatus Eisenbacteria bacterium]